jgi:hypothetical protein
MAIHAYAATAPHMLPPLRLDERAPAQLQLPSIHELLPDFEKVHIFSFVLLPRLLTSLSDVLIDVAPTLAAAPYSRCFTIRAPDAP